MLKRRVVCGLSKAARPALQPFWSRLERVALVGMGYINYDPACNGEYWLLDQLGASSNGGLTLVDVGANEGEYTDAALTRLRPTRLIGVEPNPPTFERLRARFDRRPNVELLNCALGSAPGTMGLYDYVVGHGSGHASLDPRTFELLYTGPIEAVEVDVATFDAAVMPMLADDDAEIFVKIDVEGSEVEVLRGAQTAIESKRIAMIQVEWNEHQIPRAGRIAQLRDLLPGFELYRLLPRGLQPLSTDTVAYSARVERFCYSNVVAIHTESGLLGALRKRSTRLGGAGPSAAGDDDDDADGAERCEADQHRDDRR